MTCLLAGSIWIGGVRCATGDFPAATEMACEGGFAEDLLFYACREGAEGEETSCGWRLMEGVWILGRFVVGIVDVMVILPGICGWCWVSGGVEIGVGYARRGGLRDWRGREMVHDGTGLGGDDWVGVVVGASLGEGRVETLVLF